MTTVNMLEAKTHLSRLVEAVENGTETEVVIARNGRSAAKLVPIAPRKSGVRLGVAEGKFKVPEDIDRDNDLIAKMFYGEDFDEEEFIRGGRKGVMRLLLDTHIALWAVAKRALIPPHAAALIEDPENSVVVSAVTIWEIAIKHRLQRGSPDDMPISGNQAKAYFEMASYDLLPVSPDHAAAVDNLPLLHSDPFDRLLVAQALYEPLRLVTHDKRVAAYSNHFILV